MSSDSSYPRIICFKTHEDGTALCEHHYLDDYEGETVKHVKYQNNYHPMKRVFHTPRGRNQIKRKQLL